jgi:hypothetical protein
MDALLSVEGVARMLAGEHATDDLNISEIYWAPHDKEVRLVEVTSSVTDKGEVLPFRFTADPPEVPYQSVVVLLSPGDWQRRAHLEWPEGFTHPTRVFVR